MKLGINITYTPTGGSLSQIVNMLNHLNKIDNIEITLYLKKSNLILLEKVIINNNKLVFSSLAESSVIGRVIWEQLILPFRLKRDNITILFCPGNIAPIFTSSKTIQWIGTIGPFWEEIYSYNIDLLTKIKFLVIKALMYKSAQKSDAIIFESNYTKNLFNKKYSIDLKKSHVIQIGKDKFFYNENNLDFNEFDKTPFILCVSHLYFYKHIPEMINAFAIAKRQTNTTLKLLIAGSKTSDSYYKLILDTIKNLKLDFDVILLGSVSKDRLRHLYSNCEFFIFPSPCENFAYTLVEAMSCGAAIASSNTTAMPETCDNAAVYFDPNNIEEMSEKIVLLITDKLLREKLKNKSYTRVKQLPEYRDVTNKFYKIIEDLLDE